MLRVSMHAMLFVCCLGAALSALLESWRPNPRSARWAASFTAAAAFLLLADWIILLMLDSRRYAGAYVWVVIIDCVIILGIAWIPCFLLLKLPLGVLRTPVYITSCVLALGWIGWHTPTHVLPPGGIDTKVLTVAMPMIWFAFLNLVLVIAPSRGRNAMLLKEIGEARLGWGSASAAFAGAIAVAAVGVVIYW